MLSQRRESHSFSVSLHMPRDYSTESLSHDPIHGYIPFVGRSGLPAGEVAEQQLIDHPWVQRLRQIHQLQTAWWVFPTAEHTRFQHVLGVMHLASQAVEHWYESLSSVCQDVPSRAYVESLMRMAALLHDVGHGPFGHFFDDHYLHQFGITHETLGSAIIQGDLADLLRGIRRNPRGTLQPDEQLDPAQVAWLIQRPRSGEDSRAQPDWLAKLRSLFCGIYTVDNMDFVLRDAFMSGYNIRSFDLSRLLHYSFFTPAGLTLHARGLPSLIQFIEVRSNLFRTIYFHRTVRALDVALEDIFEETMHHLFPGNPLESLADYQFLTESSFLVDVRRWTRSNNATLQALGQKWQNVLTRNVQWKMAAEKTVYFQAGQSEQMSIFSEPELVLRRLRERLPASLRKLPLKVDVARHYHRPSTRLPVGGLNYVFDPLNNQTRTLDDFELFRMQPLSFSMCRAYALNHDHDREIQAALTAILGTSDAKTNM